MIILIIFETPSLLSTSMIPFRPSGNCPYMTISIGGGEGVHGASSISMPKLKFSYKQTKLYTQESVLIKLNLYL